MEAIGSELGDCASTTVVDRLKPLLHGVCSDSIERCCGALYATAANGQSAQTSALFGTRIVLKNAACLASLQVIEAKFALELEQTAYV